MKTSVHLPAALVTIIPLVFLLVAGSGCRTFPSGAEAVASYNAHPLEVSIPPGVSAATVDQLAAVTLRNRGWAVTDQRSGAVTGHINHRGVDATVTLQQENNSVRIVLVDATRYNRADGTSHPTVPHNWLENLRKDLDRRLIRSI